MAATKSTSHNGLSPKGHRHSTESRQSWSPSLGAGQWTDTFCLQRPTWRQMFCFSVFVSS